MKTLITNLYQNFSNRLQIDLEFQYVTVTNNYEQTSTKYNVFINQKNDFGNFKVQPYIKFTYLKTKANNPSALEQTPAIYLSLYHIYDLKRNFRKTMKFFESNAYVRDQNGNLSISDELQRQSAWEISNIGAKNHFIKCFNSVTARTITDYSGNETEKVVEPTAILSLDTMNGQAVAIPYNDFKSLYMLINDNLFMQHQKEQQIVSMKIKLNITTIKIIIIITKIIMDTIISKIQQLQIVMLSIKKEQHLNLNQLIQAL